MPLLFGNLGIGDVSFHLNRAITQRLRLVVSASEEGVHIYQVY